MVFMSEHNRRQELQSLLAAIQSPGQAVPIPELAEFLRLVCFESICQVS